MGREICFSRTSLRRGAHVLAPARAGREAVGRSAGAEIFRSPGYDVGRRGRPFHGRVLGGPFPGQEPQSATARAKGLIPHKHTPALPFARCFADTPALAAFALPRTRARRRRVEKAASRRQSRRCALVELRSYGRCANIHAHHTARAPDSPRLPQHALPARRRGSGRRAARAIFAVLAVGWPPPNLSRERCKRASDASVPDSS